MEGHPENCGSYITNSVGYTFLVIAGISFYYCGYKNVHFRETHSDISGNTLDEYWITLIITLTLFMVYVSMNSLRLKIVFRWA